MEKRRDPLEGFDWVFKPESVSPPPDMHDDSFEQLFGRGPTMNDLDPITEIEPVEQPEPAFLVAALREHPRLRRTVMRTGLAVGAIITGVTAAFITHTPATSTEAAPSRAVAPQSSGPSRHTTAPAVPSKKKYRAATNPAITPAGFASSISTTPPFVPHTIMPTPTASETVDATSRPPVGSTSPAAVPSNTCTPGTSPSETAAPSLSPVDTGSPSPSSTDVGATPVQTETPLISQSPSLDD